MCIIIYVGRLFGPRDFFCTLKGPTCWRRSLSVASADCHYPDRLPICACVAAADRLIALLVGNSAQQEPSWLQKERLRNFSLLLLSKQSREEAQFTQQQCFHSSLHSNVIESLLFRWTVVLEVRSSLKSPLPQNKLLSHSQSLLVHEIWI